MDFKSIAYSLPGILLGLTLHEFCHAWAAYKLGDHTAKEQGRLSLNPLRHIDLLGFLFIIIAGFGWAKPVQFNPENLKKPRRDKALIAAAGPLSNFLLALFFVFLIKGYLSIMLNALIGENSSLTETLTSPFYLALFTGVLQAAFINLGLFIFNLLPLPPLDGSHIFLSGLNLAPATEARIMKIGAPILFIIIIVQNRTGLEILPIGRLIRAIMNFLIPELYS